MERHGKGVRLYGKQVRDWSSPPPASPGIFYSSYEFPTSEDGDEGTASVHSHSSTGYHSGFHSSAGLHSGSNSSITLAGSNHFTPTHNSVPTTKLQPHHRNTNYITPQSYQLMEETVYNAPPQVYSQGYHYPITGVISSASSTGHTSQFEHVYTPKVSCPMAKVAPYSAQVNRVVTMPASSSSISADGIPYQDIPDHRDARAHMMQQQMKALSLGEDGMYGPVDATNYNKWNGLIELKDQIMMQKDQLVERQKQTISRLQQECREYEARMKQLTLSRSLEEAGVIGIRLQELEHENASLSAQLSEQLAVKNSEIEALTYKLGAAEYELENAVKNYAETSEELHTTITTLRNELSEKSAAVTKKDEEMLQSVEEKKKLQEQLEQLQQYLGNTPSPEQHLHMKNELSLLQADKDRLTKMLLSKDDELQSTSKLLNNKQEAVRQLEKEVTLLKATITQMESTLIVTKDRNTELHSRQLSSEEELTALRHKLTEAEHRCKQELQAMRERHRLKFNDSTSKLRSQCKALAKRVVVLETQLSKNSDAMMSLNEELQTSQGTIVGLKTSMKELVSHNQELMKANLNSQDINEMNRAASSLSEGDEEKLMAELCQCLMDFESIVSLATSVMDGKCSHHLPHASSTISSHNLRESLSSPTIWRDKLPLMKREIERLRATVSEYLAEEVVNSCNLQ